MRTDTRTRTDGHERRTVMEKTGTYRKDRYLWKKRALMEKTGTYGKDGKKAFKSEIRYSHRAQPVLHI